MALQKSFGRRVLMKLEEIGFYTMSDERCAKASGSSPLSRCELILTSRCNFKCPYCRRVGGDDLKFSEAAKTVMMWAADGLKAIRFSGGEPTIYPGIYGLVAMARDLGIEHVAISTNGSANRIVYERLLACGANDFSVSLDACCAEDGEKMSGGVKGSWETVVDNIRFLSSKTYVTVGVVLTPFNIASVNSIIEFADSLGVADIRIIPAAQDGDSLKEVKVRDYILKKHPILSYRIANIKAGKSVRGLESCDYNRCGLALDDMAVCGNKHYPCIIYMRESGKPIGDVGPNMRQEREAWALTHNTCADPICSKNCLDVCRDYNNKFVDLLWTK
jgi:MoaA/NifB/PqqE/SkfB family radical SAM enzyme